MNLGERTYKFTEVNTKQHSQNYRSEVDENPVITKKGKKINLRDYVNEGFESADLATNLRRFGSIENIKKENAFLMLDDEILEGDLRDLIEIQKRAGKIYNQLSLEERRNLSQNQFVRDFQAFKNQKETEKQKINTNINIEKNEVKHERNDE